MKRPVVLGLSVLTYLLVVSGCGHERGLQAADPTLLAAVSRAGSGLEPLSRAQKPEGGAGNSGVMPLDMPPERSGDVVSVPAAARIRVTVNGEAILDEEIKATCYPALLETRNLPDPERTRKQVEIYVAARDQLIDREVVLQDAFARLTANKNSAKFLDKLKDAATREFEKNYLKVMKERSNSKTDEELKARLRSEGLSLEMAQRQWERNFMAMEYLRNRIWPFLDKVGHSQILEYYDTHPDDFQVTDLVDWQDIFIDASRHLNRDAARRFAEVLVARARAGQDFAKLAEQFDNGLKNENAAGIGHKKGEIKPAEAEALLFKLQEGEVGAPIDMPTGFHVVKVVKRTYAGMQPFDEKVQKAVRDKLRNEVGQREMKRIVTELKRKAIIEYSRSTN